MRTVKHVILWCVDGDAAEAMRGDGTVGGLGLRELNVDGVDGVDGVAGATVGGWG